MTPWLSASKSRVPPSWLNNSTSTLNLHDLYWSEHFVSPSLFIGAQPSKVALPSGISIILPFTLNFTYCPEEAGPKPVSYTKIDRKYCERCEDPRLVRVFPATKLKPSPVKRAVLLRVSPCSNSRKSVSVIVGDDVGIDVGYEVGRIVGSEVGFVEGFAKNIFGG